MTSPENPAQVSRGSCGGCLFQVLLAAVLVVGYPAYCYWSDQRNYNAGHHAYQRADCATAIAAFDRVTSRQFLKGLGGFAARASREQAECASFQAAAAQRAKDPGLALAAYHKFISDYNSGPLAEAGRKRIVALFEEADTTELVSHEACTQLNILLAKGLVPQPETHLPPLYLACGKLAATAGAQQDAYAMYVALLDTYPDHALAPEAEAALLASPQACANANGLRGNERIASRTGFLPTLYYTCGQAYVQKQEFVRAISMYEQFLADYPADPRADEVRTALADAIVVNAGKSPISGKIPEPQRSGATTAGTTVTAIQNNSPQRLRIVFKGAETRIEELEPCADCTTYFGRGPVTCPDLGPVGRYTLQPGEYDVVVEAISGNNVTPFIGRWSLESGRAYSNCFFIVTNFR